MRALLLIVACASLGAAACGGGGDLCDVCDSDAICTVTNDRLRCECRSGFEGNGLVCTPIGGCTGPDCPDPCDPSPCGAGADCRVDDDNEHQCECDRVTFQKPSGATSTVDCVSETVCIARNDNGALYNSRLESSHSAVMGEGCAGTEPEPTLTEWSLFPCDETSSFDFGTFTSIDFADCAPPEVIVGVHGCLHLTDTDEFWDIEFTDWCSGEGRGGGCFAYSRWRDVDDGVSCL